MARHMKKVVALLTALIMFIIQLPTTAYAQNAALPSDDWDTYVQNHRDKFESKETDDWNQKFEALQKELASGMKFRSRSIDNTPRYIVLAIDNSGSMYGRPISATKVAALRFCQQAFANTSNTHIALITYDDYAVTLCDFTNDINTLSNAISHIQDSGLTSHYDGLYRADSLLSKITVTGASKNIVIMSDGLPNDGPTSYSGPYTSSDYSSYRYANAAVNYARELHQKYSIYALGFFHSLYGSNLTFGRRFMADLANCGYWEVNDPDDLEFTFGDIADQIVSAKSGTFKYGGQINQERDSTATYYYSDAYFNDDARVKNLHLATMSLCLELSAWTSKDVPDPNQWGTAEQRAQNAINLLTEIGFTNVETSPDMDSSPQMHSMGAVAAYKNIQDTTVIALAVRGGGYYDEWGGNFVLGTSGNHEGFENGRDEVLKFLKNYIHKHHDDADGGFNDTVKLWIVGYSRGGAVANMVAGYLTDNGILSEVTFKQENIFAYTFEAPQGHVGDNTGYANIHNFVYTYDIVPLVAPSTWHFNRYNSDDILFTVGMGSKEYEQLLKVVKTEYDEVLAGVPDCEDKRKISEFALDAYATQFDFSVSMDPEIHWDWFNTSIDWNFDMSFTSTDYDTTTEELVTSTINRVFNYIPGERSGYVALVEEPASEVISFLARYDKEIDWAEVIYEALFADACKGARQVIGELLNPFARNNQERIDNAAAVMADLIIERAKDLVTLIGDITQLQTGLVTLLGTVIASFIDDPGEFFSLVYYLVDSHFQCHWPEIILAYMMCRDDYYTDSTAFHKDYPESYRVIHINCPVDVTVYDKNGAVLSSIRDDQVTNNSSVHGAAITKNGTKQVILPSDASYRIDITATDDGEMDFSVLEYNVRDGHYNLLQNYQNLKLDKGDMYKATIPAYITSDYFDAESDGSTTEYTLIGPDGYIAPTTILQGEEIETASVTVSANTNRGVVTGGGEYIVSEYAQVEATCLPTVDFLGWYQDGKLVSSDAKYRFEVMDDVKLVAHFSEGEFYQLNRTSTGGGNVGDGCAELPAGVKITMTAVAEAGYEFVCWESTAGEFSDSYSEETVFTMPASDATITAVFKNSNALTITQQPTDQYVVVGQRATFSVGATGDNVTYQWYINRNKGNGWRKIDGAVGATYITSVTDLDCDGFKYYCKVTDQYGNTINSNEAVLHVTTAPVLPETGDSSTPMLWLAMSILSMAGILLLRKKAYSR